MYVNDTVPSGCSCRRPAEPRGFHRRPLDAMRIPALASVSPPMGGQSRGERGPIVTYGRACSTAALLSTDESRPKPRGSAPTPYGSSGPANRQTSLTRCGS